MNEEIKNIEPNLKVYWYNFGETDFKTLLTKAKNDNVDAIFMLGWTNEFLPFFQQKTELGYNFNILCGSGSECLNNKIIKSIPRELDGTLTFDYSDLTNTNFARKYKEKFPEATKADLSAAAHGYEDVILISEAAKLCKEITSECIKDNLENVKDYTTALKSKGFKDRVLQIDTKIYTFKEGRLMETA